MNEIPQSCASSHSSRQQHSPGADVHHCGHDMRVFLKLWSFTPQKRTKVLSDKKLSLRNLAHGGPCLALLARVLDRRFCSITRGTPPCCSRSCSRVLVNVEHAGHAEQGNAAVHPRQSLHRWSVSVSVTSARPAVVLHIDCEEVVPNCYFFAF